MDGRLRVEIKECFRTFQNQVDRSFQNGISIPIQTADEITVSGMMTVRLPHQRWTEITPLLCNGVGPFGNNLEGPAGEFTSH